MCTTPQAASRAQPPQRPRGTLAMGPWRASRFHSCSGGLVAASMGLLPSWSLMCFKRNLLSDPKVRRSPNRENPHHANRRSMFETRQETRF